MVWLIRCPLNLHLQPGRTPLSSAKNSTELHSLFHHTDISQNPPELRQRVWSIKLIAKGSVEVDFFLSSSQYKSEEKFEYYCTDENHMTRI